LKGERVRERALQSRTLTDRRSITLPLCVLAAGAVHGLAVMALLPVMITVPGPASKQQGASQLVDVDVDVMPASEAACPIAPRDLETTAAIPAAEDHPTLAPAPDRDADDAGGDDATVPPAPGIAAVPEPRLEPAATVVIPVSARIPEPLPPKAESEPAVSVPPAPAVEEASPPPDAKANDQAPPQIAAPARLEPARLDGSGGAAATAVEPAEPEAEADAVEEEVVVPPPEAEAAKEMEPQPDAKSQEAPPPVPTLKPAKSAEPKARLTPQKKASGAPAKRRTARVRRPVRTRTVTTVTQGGLLQDLFGPPQPAKGAALRQPTKKQ
jgi:hypothetical protein